MLLEKIYGKEFFLFISKESVKKYNYTSREIISEENSFTDYSIVSTSYRFYPHEASMIKVLITRLTLHVNHLLTF